MTTRTKSAVLIGALLAFVASVLTAQTIVNRFMAVTIDSTAPTLLLNESDASADNKKVRLLQSASVLSLQFLNDAESVAGTPLFITRSTTTPGSATWAVTQHLSADGTAGAPMYGFSADTGTGLYRYGAGSIGFASSGSLVGRYDGPGGYWQLDKTLFVAPPAATLALNATGTTIVAQFNRTGSDGTIVQFQQDGTVEGDVTVAGTTISYNAFMGSHWTQLQPGQVAPELGTVVVTTGRLIPSHVAGDEKFVFVEPSRARNQAGVFGVWHGSVGHTAAGMSWGDPTKTVFQVAGLGLSPGVWVTDTCGRYIPKGALLASSPRAGLAERQCIVSGRRLVYDPLVRDTTLGKAVVSVDFAKVKPDAAGVRKVRVPAVLYAG